jgi:hypothetical protein
MPSSGSTTFGIKKIDFKYIYHLKMIKYSILRQANPGLGLTY